MRPFRYATLCSGIEATAPAWEHLRTRHNWQHLFVSEIDQYASKILAVRCPGVPNLGDIKHIDGRSWYGRLNLILGGTPCQDFSVAGSRAGMDGERSGLAREFLRIISEARPAWVVWENVPGVLSSNGGRDFAMFLSALATLGYCCAWRVLDAQHFGLAQRRKRAFVVGHSGPDWRHPASVLFEHPSLDGFVAEGRHPRQNDPGDAAHNPILDPAGVSSEFSERSDVERVIGTLTCDVSTGAPNNYVYEAASCPPAPCLTTRPNNYIFEYAGRVRKLLPVECARLMGFPDDWLWGSDRAQYRGYGNSIAVPVLRWIGERIEFARHEPAHQKILERRPLSIQAETHEQLELFT